MAQKGRGRIWIGASGWHYGHWLGPFYPPGLPKSRWFAYYADHFKTVEINASFYRRLTPAVVAAWSRTAPAGFLFALKAHRGITHFKKLKDVRQPVAEFLTVASGLGEALGPILFQLPPRWRFDAVRLRDFLADLPVGPRYVLELRDPSWINDTALSLLAASGVAFCVYELAGFRSPEAVTAPFAYLRLHGPAGAYQGLYGRAGLDPWARTIGRWAGQGLDVYCYCDNDQNGYAARDAAMLAALLEAGRGA